MLDVAGGAAPDDFPQRLGVDEEAAEVELEYFGTGGGDELAGGGVDVDVHEEQVGDVREGLEDGGTLGPIDAVEALQFFIDVFEEFDGFRFVAFFEAFGAEVDAQGGEEDEEDEYQPDDAVPDACFEGASDARPAPAIDVEESVGGEQDAEEEGVEDVQVVEGEYAFGKADNEGVVVVYGNQHVGVVFFRHDFDSGASVLAPGFEAFAVYEITL